MLALLRDYNHLAKYYAPEVESSHVLSDHGGVATVAMRMKKQKVVTVVLDTEYDVRTGLTGATVTASRAARTFGRSRKRARRTSAGCLRATMTASCGA